MTADRDGGEQSRTRYSGDDLERRVRETARTMLAVGRDLDSEPPWDGDGTAAWAEMTMAREEALEQRSSMHRREEPARRVADPAPRPGRSAHS